MLGRDLRLEYSSIRVNEPPASSVAITNSASFDDALLASSLCRISLRPRPSGVVIACGAVGSCRSDVLMGLTMRVRNGRLLGAIFLDQLR